jgi:hypothetical protein
MGHFVFFLCQAIILVWFFFWQMHARWQLRASAFRQAGADAGRRGIDEQVVPARLQQPKAAFEMLGLTWSAHCFRTLNWWRLRAEKNAQDRLIAEQELQEARAKQTIEAGAIECAEKTCIHRFGYIPGFTPWYEELFWAWQILIGLCEFPMNAIAMESAGRSENVTLFIAGILSVIFVIMAHLIGEEKADGKSPFALIALSVGGIFTIAKIREAAIVAYAESLRSADSQSGAVEPIYFVLLFCGIQCLLFYFAVHMAAKHYDPVRAGYRRARLTAWKTERLGNRRQVLVRRHAAKETAIQNRFARYAVRWANDWMEIQNLFDQRVHIFAEAADLHRTGPPTQLAPLALNEPLIMAWVRDQLSQQNKATGRPGGLKEVPKMKTYFATFMLCVALTNRVSGETQQFQHRAVLVDLSPSMKPYRAQQLEAIRHVIEKWEPFQTIDFLAVEGNPLGRAPLGHIAAFPYDSHKSNPMRHRIETSILRHKYLATILPGIERVIAAEDEKYKRNPSAAETCLLDGLEAAARAFRRVASQSRELLILSDGYEDCRGSIHLPKDRLSPAGIEAIIHDFERQNRLPRFAAPVTAYFIGTRLNGASPRSYEDMVEQFWIKLLTRCGAQLRPDNFTPTLQGATMYIWPDDMELLRLNSRDRLLLKHMFDGTIITGAKGSAKTSATAAHLHAGLLEGQCGGVVVCPKPTDYRDYMGIIRQRRREQDVILMRPTADWTETPINAINILDAEQKLFGRGKANVCNVTALLMKVSDLIQRQGGQASAGGDTGFWRDYGKKLIGAGLTVQSIISNRFDLKLLLKFVNTLPNTLDETENQNLYSVAQVQEAAAKLGENPPYEFTGLVWDFVMREWPLSPPNSRASGALTVSVMLNTLLSHPMRQMLFESNTFDLDRVLNHGGILLLDMDVQTYAQGGIAGMILKDLVARACQARPELSTLEPQFIQPVYLLYDEYPAYAIQEDEAHARTGRSGRLIPVFITQSTTSLKAQFHDKDKASALLDLAGCRFAHSNGSNETNTWMADTIGKVIVKRKGGQTGTNTSQGPQFQWGNNQGQNYSEQMDYDCPPRAFTRLLRGGTENKLKAEAIFWRNGDQFRWNGRRFLPLAFRQDFRPGHDEVRVTAKAMMEGGNRVQEFTSDLFDSAAEAGRQRLRSLFR